MICLLLVRRRLRLPADLGWWWALPDRSYLSEGADDTRIRVIPARRCSWPARGRTRKAARR
ncbi:MAG TPA: hypothetical protein VMV06_00520 [Acidimicrobiales bacterium]|nr:hypothetical protein [Acidimicrobiales bacterium]